MRQTPPPAVFVNIFQAWLAPPFPLCSFRLVTLLCPGIPSCDPTSFFFLFLVRLRAPRLSRRPLSFFYRQIKLRPLPKIFDFLYFRIGPNPCALLMPPLLFPNVLENATPLLPIFVICVGSCSRNPSPMPPVSVLENVSFPSYGRCSPVLKT